MANLIRWDRPRGSVHDLQYALGLGEAGCHVLLISDVTLYVLENLAHLDLHFVARWAAERTDRGYYPVHKDHADYQAWNDLVDRIEAELMPVDCDLRAGLQAIADALASQPSGGTTVNCYPGTVGDCLVNVPNEDWQHPPEDTEGDPETDPPPEGFETWEEYFTYKCQASHFIFNAILTLVRGLGALTGLELAATIIVPVVAGFAGLLPAVLTPVGFVTLVGAIVAIGLASIFGIGVCIYMATYLNDHKDEIICAMYNSGSSADALTAISGAIEDAIEAGLLAAGLGELVGPVVAGLLGEAFGQIQNTGLVEPLFKLTADVAWPGADCTCASVGDCFLVTTDDPDLLDVEIGLVEQSGTTSPGGGWRTNTVGIGGGHVTFGFTTGAEAVEAVKIECYMADNSAPHTVKLQILDHPDHNILAQKTDLVVVQNNPGGWQFFTFVLPVELSANTRYDLRLPEDPTGLEVWINRVRLCQYA